MYAFTHCQKYTDKIDWTIQLSPVAQLVEQSAVNRLVASSSLAGGACQPSPTSMASSTDRALRPSVVRVGRSRQNIALKGKRQYREILTALPEKNGSATKKTLSHQFLDNHPFLGQVEYFPGQGSKGTARKGDGLK
jgi:hypothetical protein